MALVTFGTPAAKGASSTVTLDKLELLDLPEVAGDAYWSVSANIQTVVILFTSDAGGQDKFMFFDYSQVTPTASFTLSDRARDVFEIKKIILKDFDGGELRIDRSTFITSTPSLGNLDIDLSVVPPPNSLLGLLASADLIQWYKADTLSQSDNSDISALSDSSGHSWSVTADLVNNTASSTKPKFLSNQINGKPAIKFNDGSAHLKAEVPWNEKIVAGNNYSMHHFALVKRSSAPSYSWFPAVYDLAGNGALLGTQILSSAQSPAFGIRAMYQTSGPTARDVFTASPLAADTWTILEFIKDGVNLTVKAHTSTGTDSVTEVQAVSQPVVAIGSPRFQMGRSAGGTGGSYFVAEFACFRKALSVAERAEVLSYLTGKYAIPTV